MGRVEALLKVRLAASCTLHAADARSTQHVMRSDSR